MKTYIFLTSDGETKDGAGEIVENCQFIATAKGESALDAYNNMLRAGDWSGFFDTCFCYELVNENWNRFDLINDVGD